MIADEFRADSQGRRYADVLAIPGFLVVLSFFDDRGRQRRMDESELHHDRPALAGVIREFEQDKGVKNLFEGLSPKEAVRFRQAVGVIVRLVMVKLGWNQTSQRGSLPNRLSKWFTRSERYGLMTFD